MKQILFDIKHLMSMMLVEDVHEHDGVIRNRNIPIIISRFNKVSAVA